MVGTTVTGLLSPGHGHAGVERVLCLSEGAGVFVHERVEHRKGGLRLIHGHLEIRCQTTQCKYPCEDNEEVQVLQSSVVFKCDW